MGGLVADLRSMPSSEIIRLIDAAFEDRTGIHRELQSRMPSVRVAVLNLFAEAGRRGDAEIVLAGVSHPATSATN
jgi:hypothetical protein